MSGTVLSPNKSQPLKYYLSPVIWPIKEKKKGKNQIDNFSNANYKKHCPVLFNSFFFFSSLRMYIETVQLLLWGSLIHKLYNQLGMRGNVLCVV